MKVKKVINSSENLFKSFQFTRVLSVKYMKKRVRSKTIERTNKDNKKNDKAKKILDPFSDKKIIEENTDDIERINNAKSRSENIEAALLEMDTLNFSLRIISLITSYPNEEGSVRDKKNDLKLIFIKVISLTSTSYIFKKTCQRKFAKIGPKINGVNRER
jgi:hypothetical protein